ncbi:hypothetical protein BGZ83_003299 [Gryganskiella cystojenkinii]|nr:hypothetical protein BGZ83_003299 [Gryganskiella cystojenkinii]
MLSPERDDSRHTIFTGKSEDVVDSVTPRTLNLELRSLESSIMANLDRKLANIRQELKEEMAYLVKDVAGTIAEQLGISMMNHLGSLTTGTTPKVQALVKPFVLIQKTDSSASTTVLTRPSVSPTELAPEEPVRSNPHRRAPRIPNVKTWQDCVRQFMVGDRKKGLIQPLQHWTKGMRQTDPSRYSQRKLIADEFFRLHSSEENMKEVHGAELKTAKRLITSIRRVRKEGRSRQSDQETVESEEEHVEDEEDEKEEEVLMARRSKRQRF